MKRILVAFGLALSGLFGLLICAAVWPLLAALRVDRRERNASQLGEPWHVAEIGYDDNDAGTDVDE